MGSFDGLYIGLSGLRAQQLVQEMVGHNITNASNPAFSRRDAILAAIPQGNPAGAERAGGGVVVSEIRRSASALLNRQIERENAALGYWENLRDGTAEVQQLFQEPGKEGIGTRLDDFWTSWQDLSVDATSVSARANVARTADLVASSIRRAAAGVTSFIDRLGTLAARQVADVNQLAAEIAVLNGQLVEAVQNGEPGLNLRDHRDALLEQLNALAEVRVAENADGSIGVSLGGHILVGRAGPVTIDVELGVDGAELPVWSDDHTAITVEGGALSATNGLREWAAVDMLAGLDRLATAFMNRVNAVEQGAFTTDGQPGVALFEGTGAADMRLSQTIIDDPSRIAIAASDDAPGDTSVALALANLRNEALPGLGETANDAYATLVGSLALATQKADVMAAQQGELMNFLHGKRAEVAGVSLDDEAVRMLGSQRAYQAAARVITAVDEMLDKLINDTGIVGR